MFERNVGLQLFEGNIESEHIHFLGTEQAQPRTLRQRLNQTAYDPLVQSAGLCLGAICPGQVPNRSP